MRSPCSDLMPWPIDRTFLSEDLANVESSNFEGRLAGLPKEFAKFRRRRSPVETQHALYQYVRARGLTFLRHRLNDARLSASALGRPCVEASRAVYPGVTRKRFLRHQEKKPLISPASRPAPRNRLWTPSRGKQMAGRFRPPTPLQGCIGKTVVKESDGTGTNRDDRGHRQQIGESGILRRSET